MENRKTGQRKLTIAGTENNRDTKFIKFVWNNTKNSATYKKMPIDCFKQKAVQGGLDNGCDVKAIKKYIKNAKSILEVGAGYGRVLNHIIKNGFKGKLFALEREQKLCRFLEKQFLQAHIIRADIRQFIIKQKFDLILWMWASLTEFSQAEQLLALKNLTLHLKIGGFLILDLISINCKTIDAINYDGHNKIITTAYGNDFIYLPSHDEIKLYAQKLNLLKKEIIIYKTKTNKKRNLYVLQKN